MAAMLPRAGPDVATAAISPADFRYQPFSAARLAALSAEHQPVFVNLTAAWCITCLVNERADARQRGGARRLRGAPDRRAQRRLDPARPGDRRLPRNFGRSGVPLYLLYDGQGNPTVLPQILTEAEVIEAVGKL